MTVAEATASLGLSERQVKRLKKGVMEEGARLPVEFKIANITTIDQANNFLSSYIF